MSPDADDDPGLRGYAASPATVEEWIAEGQRQGSDYLFLLHDSFSHDDYHEFSSIADFERTREKYSHEDVDMQWISRIIPISPAAVEHQKTIIAKRD